LLRNAGRQHFTARYRFGVAERQSGSRFLRNGSRRLCGYRPGRRYWFSNRRQLGFCDWRLNEWFSAAEIFLARNQEISVVGTILEPIGKLLLTRLTNFHLAHLSKNLKLQYVQKQDRHLSILGAHLPKS
jgi:hypothetical protein